VAAARAKDAVPSDAQYFVQFGKLCSISVDAYRYHIWPDRRLQHHWMTRHIIHSGHVIPKVSGIYLANSADAFIPQLTATLEN
jgi:hypothetical protein